MHKTWFQIIAMNLLLAGILAKLRAVLNTHIPLGYQDNAGFHFGVPNAHEE
jgi:hypothetical protein